jgi:hypothetical protein
VGLQQVDITADRRDPTDRSPSVRIQKKFVFQDVYISNCDFLDLKTHR